MRIDDEDQVIEEDEVLNNDVEEETTENEPVVSENEEISEEPETIRDESEDEDEEDRVVTIGDEEPENTDEDSDGEDHKEAPGWVKSVRKQNRTLTSEKKKLARENEKLMKQIEELKNPQPKEEELGEKPTLASCNYDEAKWEEETLKYHSRKRKIEEKKELQQKAVQERAKKQQAKVTRYVELKQEHNFKDYSESEDVVENTLSVAQQQIIVQGAEDSALLVYALGKNPKRLEELAGTKDPVEFAFKVAKLESQLKVTNKRAPKPEKKVSTGKAGGISGNGDKTLERLRSEAAKTGDYSKVTAYKRDLRNKG